MLKTSDFISYIKKTGIAKQNRYNVVLTVPSLVKTKLESDLGALAINLGHISLAAQAVNIPGYNVAIQEAIHQNSTRKVVYDKSEGEFDITFLLTGKLPEKKMFDAWKQIMFRSDHTIEYYDEYITDITIQVLNEKDEIVYETLITECYPATVGQLSLDRTARDSIQTFNVVFNFRKVKPSDIKGTEVANVVPSITSAEIAKIESNPLLGSNLGFQSPVNKFTSEYLNVIGNSNKEYQNILQNTASSLDKTDKNSADFIKGLM